MCNRWLRAVLFIAGWMLVTAQAFAETPRYIPPAQRITLAADNPWPKNSFMVLGYHDVEDGAADQRYLSVRTSALNDQFAWLRDSGYHPISVQQVLDAHAGKITLPEKAVLLTFDDGYSSFYTRVWPLLKAYNWPALWAPVGSWVDAPAGQSVDFGGLKTPRNKFATWQMVKELSQSPLVEIGAHTWASHYGIVANPQGSKLPAVANRAYDNKTGQYESDAQYEARINADLDRVTQKIAQVTGKSPRAWVWPYGAANGTTLRLARNHGYELAFTLNPGLANAANLDDVPRILITDNPSLRNFASQIAQVREPQTMRVMHIDLDYVYDKDPVQQRKNIDALIQRVYDMRVSHVFLQAYADPKGDGNVHELYFPNRWLPMRADLFNFVSWQLQTRGGVYVYAWMPVLAFDFDNSLTRVTAWSPENGRAAVQPQQYKRLSPWDPVARSRINDIYEDLARSATFQGILYHDDAFLSDFEDASPGAMRAYKAAGFPDSIAQIHSNPQTFAQWTRFKSRALIAFTQQLTQTVRAVRGPQVLTARNIYAMPVLEPQSEAWFAQNLDDFLNTYNWTAPMAMPLMEKVSTDEANAWLDKLVESVARRPGALEKTVFELQARDWRQQEGDDEISGDQLAEWMRQLKLSGAKNFGYYPDDFLNDQPKMTEVRSVFSSYWYPQK
ncbi:biofilm PGA synthesis lipoprotein PgaB [Enterobacter sp. kpr-6]|uniref:poly-beta-1,6-N-acetyl-D-glucosamine N-deacetylase PgaB n=1 Tax=Enterobacter sp. kpr-6 TaxID=1761782 RepID=UPI0008E187D2|nr:poly-beta-1,6-N-acetyl-D-glucosamine N-deacetylase PgaB [Enterobacter sp. kpr-6]SFR07251.1 biofilm PGA synthesis lipoprotein PgaB [Enterobacter sp. kpr-6]